MNIKKKTAGRNQGSGAAIILEAERKLKNYVPTPSEWALISSTETKLIYENRKTKEQKIIAL